MNPPRIEVFPLEKGSQAKPMRGDKSRRLGLRDHKEPIVMAVSPTLTRLLDLPWSSFGMVTNS